MFERCSAKSLVILMLGLRMARDVGASVAEPSHIILALYRHGENAAAMAMQNSGVTWSILKTAAIQLEQSQTAPGLMRYSTDTIQAVAYARNVAQSQGRDIEPEHLLVHMLQTESGETLMIKAGYRPEKIESELRSQLSSAVTITRAESLLTLPQKPSKPPRPMSEWFSSEAITALSNANDIAMSRSSNVVDLIDLLQAIVPKSTWLGKDLLERWNETFCVQHIPASSSTDLEMSCALKRSLIEARALATSMMHSSIQEEHLIRACTRALQLDTVVDGSELLGDIADATMRRLTDTDSTPDPNYVLHPQTPLIAADGTIYATTRVIRVLQVAHELASHDIDSIAPSHALLALIDEGWRSEVGFVKERADVVLALEPRIKRDLSPYGPVEGIPFAQHWIENAIKHAQRLNSPKLDANHLTIALLDYDHASIKLAVQSISSDSRSGLRRRLEMCLLYQTRMNPEFFNEADYVDFGDLRNLLKP